MRDVQSAHAPGAEAGRRLISEGVSLHRLPPEAKRPRVLAPASCWLERLCLPGCGGLADPSMVRRQDADVLEYCSDRILLLLRLPLGRAMGDGPLGRRGCRRVLSGR